MHLIIALEEASKIIVGKYIKRIIRKGPPRTNLHRYGTSSFDEDLSGTISVISYIWPQQEKDEG